MTLLDDGPAQDSLAASNLKGVTRGDGPKAAGVGGPPPHSDEGLPEEPVDIEPALPARRVGLVVGATVVAAGVCVGTVFEGIAPKVLAPVAGLVGVAVAAQAARRRSPLAVNLIIPAGIIGAGLVLVLSGGFDGLSGLVGELRVAAESRKVLRPPAEFLPGFRAITGWVMAGLGFAAGWLGMELRRPAMGLLAPLPVIIIAAISVPDSAKLPVGVVVLVLFIAGLAMLGSLQGIAAGGAGAEAPSLGYEMRRLARLVPVLGVLVIVLVLLAQSNILFPPPLYDPVRDAQRPKAVPLSAVEDKVLFEVRSQSTGPWRIGLLDVYDGEEWRLPAFAESELRRVPTSGVVNETLAPGTRADFLVKGLGGAVLPGLPNTVAILAKGPRLGFDARTGTIRLAEGQIDTGLTYTVTGAALPTEEQLLSLTGSLSPQVERFAELEVAPPPRVAQLLDEAPATPAWARLEFLRRRLLETVTAAGPGTPAAVPPEKVDDMLFGSKEASPFEIVAAQALLARWAGIPSRIGYGYDGGEILSENVREIRPRHGASWLEVWFPNFQWIPVVGAPLKAKPNLSSEGPTNADPRVEASDDIAVEVFIPLRLEQRGLLYDRIRRIALLATPFLLLGGLLWLLWPAATKAWRRARLRGWAARTGPVARIEVAYREFRDYCIDLGLPNESATPLGFLDGFVDDPEHLELAWLVTRTLYGDLRDEVEAEDALAAEELSRSLRRRLAQTQPASLRFVAWVSRLSVRQPYYPTLKITTRKERRELAPAA